MLARQRPIWDVRESTILLSAGHDRLVQVRTHTRIYADGHGAMAVNGVWHPIPPTMTAAQFLTMAFAEVFAAAPAAAVAD